MIKLGFAGAWLDAIMSCVTPVSYSFLVNGTPCGSVTPSRGLRQGDSLSPYFFILLSNAFSSLSKKANDDGLLHSARASRVRPAISHLLLPTTVFFLQELTFTNAPK